MTTPSSTGRIHICAESDEILNHLAHGPNSILNNETPLPAEKQNNNLQAKEKINAEFCKKTDPLETVENGVSVYHACDKKNDDCDCRAAYTDSK